MRREALRISVAFIVIFAVVYGTDWMVLQIRERTGSAYGSVLVNNADVIKEKGGKVEYFYSTPQTTPCVRALFPHQGQPACWWLASHTEQQRVMN